MRDDSPPLDHRPRRGGIHRPAVTLVRSEAPWEPAVVDAPPSRLPAWPFRRPPRASEPRPSEPVRSEPRPDEPRSAGDAPRSRQFAADRAAARYAPEGAAFLVDDRSLPVVTVSMSGISVHWDAGRLPAVGARVEGEITSGTTVREFAAAFEVVRVEPERRLVAGRFAPLSGSAIDRLLSWLSQLDRSAGKA